MAVTQADIEQARDHNILHTVDRTVLTLVRQEQDRSWRLLRRHQPVWVVARRDTQLLPQPYPPYTTYHRVLKQEHWVRAVKPKGHQRANAFYRRAMIVAWTPEGQFASTPRGNTMRRFLAWLLGLLRVGRSARAKLPKPTATRVPKARLSTAERLRRLEEAMAFSRQHLAAGHQPAKMLLQAAKAAGIAERTLHRAKDVLGGTRNTPGCTDSGFGCQQ